MNIILGVGTPRGTNLFRCTAVWDGTTHPFPPYLTAASTYISHLEKLHRFVKLTVLHQGDFTVENGNIVQPSIWG